jgi:two-component system, OmpR family, sensor histidine kinase QseC
LTSRTFQPKAWVQMKPSIRTFLLINLLLSVLLISSLAIIGNIFFSRKDIQSQLDRTLISSSLRIKGFLTDYRSDKQFAEQQQAIDRLSKEDPTVTGNIQNIVFQYWDEDGRLLLHSANTPKSPLSNGQPGLSSRKISNNTWRVFTTDIQQGRGSLMVAENFDFKFRLESRLTRDSTIIMLLTYPFLGLLIWIIVGRGLSPLQRITREIEQRAPSYLQPVDNRSVPKEVQPIITALNQLFERLLDAFKREKRFTADAAHELRTPLAAIKAHAQVALKTKDSADLEQTLQKVVGSVTRSTHVVQQLLTLSRMVPEASINDPTRMSLETEVAEVAAQIVPNALEKNIEIELLTEGPHKPFINGNPTAIAILARNLIDNAVRYSPQGKMVRLIIQTTEQNVLFKVIDNGPGIPEELRERVFERFYRSLGNEAVGSGLGLSIVKQITKLHNATIALNTAASGEGLEFVVSFPRIT